MFSTEVSQDAGRSGLTLTARAFVAIEGSRAKVDEGIRPPVVLSIRSADQKLFASGDGLELAGQEGKFEINVLVPDDYAVTVQADVLSQG